MKQPLKFSRALKAAIDRATARYRRATGQPLTLRQIAQDVGIDDVTLAYALRGECPPDISHLLPLLVYLGCDEEEQRFLFHLAELMLPDCIERDAEPITDECAVTIFALPSDTDPNIESITEKHRFPKYPPLK